MAALFAAITTNAKTLVVYYSFTNNVHTIVSDLRTQIDADVIRIEPAEKGIDYAANNYAAGSVLISAIRNNPDDAASYPAIDPVKSVGLRHGHRGSSAVVEQYGGTASDLPFPIWQADGRQKDWVDRVER